MQVQACTIVCAYGNWHAAFWEYWTKFLGVVNERISILAKSHHRQFFPNVNCDSKKVQKGSVGIKVPTTHAAKYWSHPAQYIAMSYRGSGPLPKPSLFYGTLLIHLSTASWCYSTVFVAYDSTTHSSKVGKQTFLKSAYRKSANS